MCDETTRQINSYFQKLKGELTIEYDTVSNLNTAYYIRPSDGELEKISIESNVIFLNWLMETVKSEERRKQMPIDAKDITGITEKEYENYMAGANSNPTTYDSVNHPKHYTSSKHGIECIDAIMACVDSYVTIPDIAWLVGQVIKYLWRAPLKGRMSEDLHKAQFYMNRIIKEIDDSK